jgi:hypothetical protein
MKNPEVKALWHWSFTLCPSWFKNTSKPCSVIYCKWTVCTDSMSIDMDRTCRVYFFIYDPDSGGEAVRQGARCFTHSNLFKLVHTGSGRVQDVLLIQTFSNWFRQDARWFTHSNLFRLVQIGSGRMQDVLLFYTYSDWFKLVQEDAMPFTHSNLFRLVQTGSGRIQEVLLIQTYSYWFKLAQAGMPDVLLFYTFSHWFKLVQTGWKMFYSFKY